MHEAAHDVEHVIRVHGGEHQVTGERRLDRDLRRLRIADFPDHDLVGIVPQYRAQAARERQTLLFVDRNLQDPRQLIFDRVFDRDDLVLPVCVSEMAAYSVVVLPLPVGPVTSSMP